MIGQLSSLVGDEVGTRVYDLLNRVQMWRVCSVFFQNRVQLWRICTVFFSDPLPPVYVLPDRVQMWRVCTVFFLFFPRCTMVGDGSPGGRKGDMVQLWRG